MKAFFTFSFNMFWLLGSLSILNAWADNGNAALTFFVISQAWLMIDLLVRVIRGRK